MRTTAMLAGIWVLAATAATGIGFAAVGLVGSDIGPAGQALAQPPLVPAPAPTQSATPAPSSSATASASAPAGVQRTRPTNGGVVTARCTGATVWLISWSPNPGWTVDEVDRGPGSDAEVRFETESARVRVTVRCEGGVPAFSVETPGEDDDGGADRRSGEDGSGSGSGGSRSNSESSDSGSNSESGGLGG